MRLWATDAWGRSDQVPAANPFVTKLASIATEVVRRFSCDLIVSWYLEPYGIAASLAAAWTGRPFVVRHAGSDRMKLMARHDLTTAYKELLDTNPERAIEKAVRGMLPKSSLARQQLGKLKVYAGAEHPHAAQQPKPFEITQVAQQAGGR